MNKNPFEMLVEVMREQGSINNPPTIILGEVVSVDPFIIQAAGIHLDSDNILIADYLLEGYERNVKISEVIGQTSLVSVGDNGSHQHDICTTEINANIKATNTFTKRDMLAIMPTADKQIFIILCKVVRL